MKLILIGLLIASLIVGYAMNQWLRNSAYLIVSYQTIKAALVNPVEGLRTE